MFTGIFRKTLGLILVSFGIGVIISLLLPFWGWIMLVAASLIILRNFVVFMLRRK